MGFYQAHAKRGQLRGASTGPDHTIRAKNIYILEKRQIFMLGLVDQTKFLYVLFFSQRYLKLSEVQKTPKIGHNHFPTFKRFNIRINVLEKLCFQKLDFWGNEKWTLSNNLLG